jgi:diguanylate cyclase (GGDEF)-like protein
MPHPRNWRVSIGAQIWLMVAVCLVLLGALIAVNSRAAVRHDKSAASAELYRRGASMVASLATAYSQTQPDPALTQLAATAAVRRLGTACDAALQPLQSAVTDGYVDVVDARGRVRCSSSKPHLRVAGAPYAGASSLLRRIGSRQFGYDAPMRNPYDGSLSIWGAAPVTVSRGVPVSLVFVGTTQSSLSPDDPDRSVESLVLDARTNTVLMHWPSLPGAVGAQLTGGALHAALASSGPVSAKGIDGVTRIYRQLPVHGTHFTLLIGVSEHTAYAAARDSLRRSLLFGAVLILVVGLLGFLLHRRISRPARKLRRAIDMFREDAAAPPAPETGPSELAQVATAFNAMVAARRCADGRFRAIVQHASDYVVVLDATGTVTYSGPAAQSSLDVHPGASAVQLLARVHADDRMRIATAARDWMHGKNTGDRVEVRLRTVDSALHYVEIVAQNLLADPAVNGVVVTGHDVTERKLLEQHLSKQARHDPLTGLANRTAVIERLRSLSREGTDDPAAVLFIDLDRFKLINDSHGHRVGDKLLLALAEQLTAAVRPGDLVGRFGGDEFVVVAAGVSEQSQAEELAQRVQRAMATPLVVDGRELFVSGSIGIAMAGTAEDAETLLRNADTAMYRAKEHGRSCYAVYDGEMRVAALRRLELENGLHRALERDELVLHYQPVVGVEDRYSRGVEALLRWRHPQRGLVSPCEFIPVAEETGLIVPIGTWVLREATMWAATTAVRIGAPVRVSVNVSPKQLNQPDFLETVDAALLASGLPPALLCLEVTETMLVQDAHTAATIFRALRLRGVRVSIDDFGTGYSSMSYLQQFAVDELKLDRSFISSLAADETTGTIVGSLIGMAHAIGVEVTAEGVEDEDQLAFLRAVGCERAQGFLFAKPRDGHAAAQLLSAPGQTAQLAAAN